MFHQGDPKTLKYIKTLNYFSHARKITGQNLVSCNCSCCVADITSGKYVIKLTVLHVKAYQISHFDITRCDNLLYCVILNITSH